MKLSIFFYGIATGSLVAAVLRGEPAIPARTYHAILLTVLSVGVGFQLFGF
jgi:hypothetical protein